MLKITVHSDLTAALAAKLADRSRMAENVLAEQVRKDTSPYVPFKTGSLDQRTRVVGNTIIYPAPYARFLYYGKVMIYPPTGSTFAPKGERKVVTDRPLKYTQDFHKLAGSHWFERSKAQNLKKWKRVAEKAVAKYG